MDGGEGDMRYGRDPDKLFCFSLTLSQLLLISPVPEDVPLTFSKGLPAPMAVQHCVPRGFVPQHLCVPGLHHVLVLFCAEWVQYKSRSGLIECVLKNARALEMVGGCQQTVVRDQVTIESQLLFDSCSVLLIDSFARSHKNDLAKLRIQGVVGFLCTAKYMN